VTADHEPLDKVKAFAIGGVDYVTKPFLADELVARVETHLHLRRLQVRLEDAIVQLKRANQRMSDDLKAAARIQNVFLPRQVPHGLPLDFGWIYRPCDELGGDGLNVIPLSDGQVALYVLDVSGHGVAAALSSVAISRLLTHERNSNSGMVESNGPSGVVDMNSPCDVAAQLNHLFAFDSGAYQYTTMVYGVLDGKTGEFRYICAGHPGPVYLPSIGSPSTIEVKSFPIGVETGLYEESTIQLAKGDRIYLYSDGIYEAANVSGIQFGKDRLLAAIENCRSRPLQDGLEEITNEVIAWRGSPNLQDDLSLLAVEFSDGAK
jgi:sigma-B regulation protein RsbU (phosphoserine phosphatase)